MKNIIKRMNVAAILVLMMVAPATFADATALNATPDATPDATPYNITHNIMIDGNTVILNATTNLPDATLVVNYLGNKPMQETAVADGKFTGKWDNLLPKEYALETTVPYIFQPDPIMKEYLKLNVVGASSKAVITAKLNIKTDNLTEIKKALKAWQPLSITINERQVTVLMDEDSVSSIIYIATIRSGVCAHLWLHPNSWDNLNGFTFWNRNKTSGWKFEGGKKECIELGKLQTEETLDYIKQHSDAQWGN